MNLIERCVYIFVQYILITLVKKTSSSLSFTQIQIADVLKELQNLDPYKSAGLNNLDPFLKFSGAIVATPITSLFNLSFVSS